MVKFNLQADLTNKEEMIKEAMELGRKAAA